MKKILILLCISFILWLIFWVMVHTHPLNIDYLGKTREDVAKSLFESHNGPLVLIIQNNHKIYNNLSELINDPSAMHAESWGVNLGENFYLRYYYVLEFKNGCVVSQKTRTYND